MRNRWIMIWGVMGIAFLLFPGRRAEASPIHYVFSGVITNADPSTGVTAGTPFSGTLDYDPTAQVTGGMSFEGHSNYIYGQSSELPSTMYNPALPVGMTLQIGDQVFFDRPGGLRVGVYEQSYPGEFGYTDTLGNPLPSSTTLGFASTSLDPGLTQFGVSLKNPDRGIFGSTLPPASFNFADFPIATLTVASPDPTRHYNHVLYTGTIERMSVLEPAAFAIFAAAFGALAIGRRISNASFAGRIGVIAQPAVPWCPARRVAC
jgi:hypothetical protein